MRSPVLLVVAGICATIALMAAAWLVGSNRGSGTTSSPPTDISKRSATWWGQLLRFVPDDPDFTEGSVFLGNVQSVGQKFGVDSARFSWCERVKTENDKPTEEELDAINQSTKRVSSVMDRAFD